MPNKLIAQIRFAFLFLFEIAQRPFRRRRHAGNGGNVFRSGPPLIFVGAAKLNRFDRQSGAQKQKTRAFRSVKFVRGETGGID